MWMYTNKVASALLFIFLIITQKLMDYFLIMSFLKIELFSKLHNPLMTVTR